MSVLKTSLLTCLKQMMEEKKTGSQVPGYRVSLSDFKTLHHLSYSLGLDPPGVSGNQLQVARGKLPSMSLPKAWTPMPPTHTHTGSTCCIFLSWPHQDARFLYDRSSVEGREGREEHQGSRSWVSWSTKAFLSSLPSSLQGSWKEETIENWSKLTLRTSVCWLLHPLHWAGRPGGRCLRPDTRL